MHHRRSYGYALRVLFSRLASCCSLSNVSPYASTYLSTLPVLVSPKQTMSMRKTSVSLESRTCSTTVISCDPQQHKTAYIWHLNQASGTKLNKFQALCLSFLRNTNYSIILLFEKKATYILKNLN